MSRRSYKKNKRGKKLTVITVIGIIILITVCIIGGSLSKTRRVTLKDGFYESLKVNERFLTPNKYSRAGEPIKKVKGVVIHYTANPGTDANANRNYFESRKNQEGEDARYVSSHYVIGLKGNIVQCVPLDEIAYASNERNVDTISIECCHLKKDGKFTKKTYNALIKLTAWLCAEYGLSEKDIIRHYDVRGKICPKYYVDHEDKWLELKHDVTKCLKENKKNN